MKSSTQLKSLLLKIACSLKPNSTVSEFKEIIENCLHSSHVAWTVQCWKYTRSQQVSGWAATANKLNRRRDARLKNTTAD